MNNYRQELLEEIENALKGPTKDEFEILSRHSAAYQRALGLSDGDVVRWSYAKTGLSVFLDESRDFTIYLEPRKIVGTVQIEAFGYNGMGPLYSEEKFTVVAGNNDNSFTYLVETLFVRVTEELIEPKFYADKEFFQQKELKRIKAVADAKTRSEEAKNKLYALAGIVNPDL